MANTLACVQQTPLPLEILRGGEGRGRLHTGYQ